MGVFVNSATIYILLFFEKYKASALSILYGVGWATAGMIGQLVFSRLGDKYGFQGAIVLLGGIMLHAIPITMLVGNPSPVSFSFKVCEALRVQNGEQELDAVGSPDNVTRQGNTERPHEAQLIVKPAVAESSSVRHTVGLFLMPSFYVIVLVIVIDDYSSVQSSTTLVDYAMDKGMTLDVAKTMISFSALGTLIGRVGVPFLSDIVPHMLILLYVFGFLLDGALLFSMPKVYSYEGVAAVTIVHGICKGTLLCLRGVLISELLGIDRMAACSGVTGLAMIPLSLASPSIIGSYRDGTGTYDGFYRMLAALDFVAALLFATFTVLARMLGNSTRTWTNSDCDKAN
ncbi:hypothetical protein HPB50_029513 [Hyalomma asiaticum]|nr:hypothetical protein HPB50_029513 [Hyalomma asiaticum]